MSAYGVIVCPKCRGHAQIIETGCSKKTRCQKCGSNLEVRKLRLFFRSDMLEEAVSARTVLQARLHGQEGDLETVFSVMSGQTGDIGDRDDVELRVTQKGPAKRKVSGKRKDKNLIILDLLRSNGGEMDIGPLMDAAKGYGIDEQKFGQVFEKLMDAGEIYEPSPGKVRII